MAFLGLVEFALSFMVIYTTVQAVGAAASFPSLIEKLPNGAVELAAVLTMTIGVVALTIGLYRPEVCRSPKRLLIAAGISTAVAFALLVALGGGLRQGLTVAQALFVAQILGAWLLTIGVIRLAFGLARAAGPRPRRVLLVGDAQKVARVHARLASRMGRRFDPVVACPKDIAWAQLRQKRIWGVVVASDPDALTVEPLLDCKLRGVHVLGGAAFQETHLGRIDLDALNACDLVVGRGFAESRSAAALKRAADVLISVAMIVATLPLMAVTALAIKADSPGSVLYRQKRIGQFDKPFTVFKFRSMTVDAEAGGSPRWAQKQDPRVTRVGRFIRATRIDELPQLANVIRGEMSLVGPRPERPHFVDQLARAIPFYRQRAYVKPGLTGWAQVNYPYGASVEDAREKLAYDLYYVKNRSLLLDLRILLATVRVVLFREGAR
jgi:exopolysaccharide biosynthesis polyprenyl glycosylphosphotransferase